MRNIWFAIVGILCAAGAAPAAASDAERLRRDTDQIKRSIFVGPAMDDLRDLIDRYGARLTGSDAYRRSAEWAESKFRSYGTQNVHFDYFTVPNAWARGWARGEIVAPAKTKLALESVGWSPPTPPGGIEAEAIWMDDVAPGTLARLAFRIKGRVVVLDTERLFKGGSYGAVLNVHAAFAPLKAAGARAILYPNISQANVLGSYVDLLSGGKLLPLPMAEIGMEDGKRLRRLLDRGPVQLRFSFDNKIGGSFKEPNVVAEIRGSERPDEWVLVGAHLDSWDYGTGASDNATGSISVLESARAIASLGHPPRRSIRFVLWGGEEAGQLGSLAYARSHAADISKIVAVLNSDTGAGRPVGWRVTDRPHLQAMLQPVADEHLEDLGANKVLPITTCSTDHCAFLLRGVPTLNLLTDRTVYEQIHHRGSDTLDKVSELDLKAGSAVVAVTAYLLAQRPDAISPHIDQAAVARLLESNGLDKPLAALGRWQP